MAFKVKADKGECLGRRLMPQRELEDLRHFIFARGEMAEQGREAVGVCRALFPRIAAAHSLAELLDRGSGALSESAARQQLLEKGSATPATGTETPKRRAELCRSSATLLDSPRPAGGWGSTSHIPKKCCVGRQLMCQPWVTVPLQGLG